MHVRNVDIAREKERRIITKLNLSVNHVKRKSWKEKRNMIDEEINKRALLQVTRANS